ncbi:MAG: hypothetical protein GXP55_18045 [Deltaproteobacteria bacterium]|nr:hypothetical protein [Deltaproteobacteria bacterium]
MARAKADDFLGGVSGSSGRLGDFAQCSLSAATCSKLLFALLDQVRVGGLEGSVVRSTRLGGLLSFYDRRAA